MKKLVSCVMPAMMTIVLLAGIVLPVQAGKTGQVQISYTCDSGKTAVQGAEFSVVCVADAELNDKGAVYTLRSEYEGSGLNPREPSFWSNKDTAQKLLTAWEKLDSSQKKATRTQETDAAGNAYCNGLSAGIYLIWQSGADKEDAYETALPLIIAVPTLSGSNLSFRDWNCKVCPKTTRKPAKAEVKAQETKAAPAEAVSQPQEAESAQTQPASRGEGTGDSSEVLLYTALCAAAAAGLFLYVRYIRRHKEKT